jgi:hypothetical protein
VRGPSSSPCLESSPTGRLRAIQQFLAWAERAGHQHLEDIEPITVAAYIESIRQSNAPSGSGVFLMQSWDDGNCRGWRGEAAKPPRN